MYRGKYAYRKKSRTILLPVILLALLLLILLPSVDNVMAYMFKRTDRITNTLKLADVSIVVDEKFENNVKSEVRVQNTSGIPVYIRVTLVEYWMKDGGYVPKPEEGTVNVVMSTNGDWQKIGDIYYHKTPVEPGKFTTPLIDQVTVTLPEGYTYHMDIYAEAIQAQGTTDEDIPAVVDAWGFNPYS